MNNNDFCEEFIEEISGKEPFSSACQAHLKTCEICRETVYSVKSFRSEKSAYSPGEIERFKDGVAKRISAAEQAEPAFLQKIVSWFRPGFSGGNMLFATGFTILILILGMNVLSKKEMIFKAGPGVYQVAWSDGKTQIFPLDAPFQIDSGSALISAPDSSSYEVVGPIRLLVKERGFYLSTGVLIAGVAPSKETFVGNTPHGQLEVLGTIFECRVASEGTLVKVISGRVLAKPSGKAQKILTAGQEWKMSLIESASPGETQASQSSVLDLQGN